MVVFLPHRRKHLVASSGPVTYEIDVRDTREWSPYATDYCSVAMLSSTVAIIAQQRKSGAQDLVIETEGIDSSYNFTGHINELTDTGTPSEVEHTSVCALDATHFVVAYHDAYYTQGVVRTYSCTVGGGSITRLDTYTFNANAGTEVQVIASDATHFVLVYTDNVDDGWMMTFSVDGSFNITEEDAYEFSAATGLYPTVTQLDATTFAICYEGPDDDGHVKTLTVDGFWDLTEVDELEFDTTVLAKPEIAAIDATHFIVAYQGTDGDGYIASFTCDVAGANIVHNNTIEHDIADFDGGGIVKIDTTHVMLAYRGPGSNGVVKSFGVDGTMYYVSEIDSFEFETVFAKACAIAQIAAQYYLVIYADTDTHGKAVTLKLS